MSDLLNRALYNADGTGLIADNDQAQRATTGEDEAKVIGIGGSDGTNVIPIKVNTDGTLPIDMSGDVNVDNNSVDTSGYIGKPAGTNGDFITARASANTITCTTLPAGVAAITANDIVAIMHLTAAGAVTATYTRDDITISAAGADPTTLTVTGGSTFGATDVFVVYTNIQRTAIELLLAVGTGVMASAQAVTLATDDTQLGAVGAAADPDGNIHGQLRSIAEAVDTLETLLAVGTGAMASAQAITLATDDTQLGAIGSAADVDGNIHGQLEFIGTAASEIEGATETIEEAIITDEAAASTKSMQIAGTYHAALPALTDGDSSAIAEDGFGRVITSNNDPAQNVNMTQDISAITGVPFRPGSWAALTAVGATAAVNIEGYKNFGVTIVIATITGAYTRERIEASRDGGTTWVNANLNQGPTGYTEYTANGNYTLEGTNRGYTHIRLYHVAEADAAVTVTGTPYASN